MYQAVAMTVAEVTVQTVGIADRYGSNHRVAFDLTLTAVAHRITCRHVAELKDGGFQGADAP